MSEKTKKILIIILFVLVIAGLALLLYFLFFKPAPTPPTPPSEKEEEVEGKEEERAKLPVTRVEWERMTIEQRREQDLATDKWDNVKEDRKAEEEKERERVIPQIDEVAKGGRTWVSPVTEERTMGVTLAPDGENSLYYDPNTGYFYRVDKIGNKTKLSDQKFNNVESINWAPTKDRAILQYPDGFQVMYDFDAEKQYTLPKNWEEFSWGPAGGRIAFKSMGEYPENTWLAVAKPDGTQADPVAHMGDNADEVTVSWSPNNQVIAFSSTGEARGVWEQEMLLIGKNQENFKSFIIDGRGFEPKWSPEGKKIAYNVYSAQSQYKPRLYVVSAKPDMVGTNKIDTGLNTWAKKCAFNNTGNKLYCAVPKELPDGSGLVSELGENTRDDFYEIDVKTGNTTFLAEGAMGRRDVKEVYVSEDDSTLYFVDEGTNRLRYIQLK